MNNKQQYNFFLQLFVTGNPAFPNGKTFKRNKRKQIALNKSRGK